MEARAGAGRGKHGRLETFGIFLRIGLCVWRTLRKGWLSGRRRECNQAALRDRQHRTHRGHKCILAPCSFVYDDKIDRGIAANGALVSGQRHNATPIRHLCARHALLR